MEIKNKGRRRKPGGSHIKSEGGERSSKREETRDAVEGQMEPSAIQNAAQRSAEIGSGCQTVSSDRGNSRFCPGAEVGARLQCQNRRGCQGESTCFQEAACDNGVRNRRWPSISW